MTKVSIVVPTYNVENYIDKCLESLVNQTLKDIEIIIIDDGSNDKTLDKLEIWSKMDKRIVLMKNDKKGAASARNSGIKASSGEYISFVDSDDYCDYCMIEKLYNALIKTNADYVFCDYFINYPDGRIESCKIDIAIEQTTSLMEDKKLLFKVDPNIWNKLYKKKMLIDNNLKFNDAILKCHDVPFTTSVLSVAKIVQVKECLYYYRANRPNSITSHFNKTSFEWENAWPVTVKYFEENGILTYYYDELEKRIIDSCFYLIKQVMYSSDNIPLIKCAINGHINYLSENFPGWKKNKYFDSNNESVYRKIELFQYISKKSMKEKPIIVFSASLGGKRILDYLNKFDIVPEKICDNSIVKQNKFLNGIEIVSPKYIIENIGRDIILIIASDLYYNDIKDQMLNLGILEDNIY